MASETQNIVPSTGSPHNLIITFWVAPSAQNNAELFWPGKKSTHNSGNPRVPVGGYTLISIWCWASIIILYHCIARSRIAADEDASSWSWGFCAIVWLWVPGLPVASFQLVVGCCFGPSSSPSSMAAEGLPYKRLTRRLPSLQTLLPFWPSLCGPFFGTLKILWLHLLTTKRAEQKPPNIKKRTRLAHNRPRSWLLMASLENWPVFRDAIPGISCSGNTIAQRILWISISFPIGWQPLSAAGIN